MPCFHKCVWKKGWLREENRTPEADSFRAGSSQDAGPRGPYFARRRKLVWQLSIFSAMRLRPAWSVVLKTQNLYLQTCETANFSVLRRGWREWKQVCSDPLPWTPRCNDATTRVLSSCPLPRKHRIMGSFILFYTYHFVEILWSKLYKINVLFKKIRVF